MTGALWILAAIIVTATILRLTYRQNREKPTAVPEQTSADVPETCCGQHEVCLKNGRKWIPGLDETFYYDDEDLDRFAGMSPDQYSDAEIEEFREIMLTLLPGEAPGWYESLRMRGISLPESVKPELELLVAETLEHS